MIIGIDASRAFIKNRTGIEEYSHQVIKNLTGKLNDHQVVLYIRKNQEINFSLPDNWKIKVIRFPYLWTQLGLSLELLFHPVDVLFIPAHTVPIVHPQNTVVTIHGLEYEFCPKAYSLWEKLYMRWSIKNSCQWAKKIIAVSNNTKKDLMKLYKVPEEKIAVVYEGYAADANFQFPISPPAKAWHWRAGNFQKNTKYQIPNTKYLLFIGRLEERKNIIGIIKAFEILKEQYKIPHKLFLVGKFGYGEDKIREELRDNNCAKEIILPGYVSEEEKWELLKNADVFLFPTFYEGFGIPILEAQSVGCPVVAGNNSSVPEVVNIFPKVQPSEEVSAILVDPNNAEEIADVAYKLISDKVLRDDIIKRGYENANRFSWEKCTGAIAEIIQIIK